MGVLMRTPAPFEDESPRAYLARLAWANGYPSPSVISDLLHSSSEYVITPGWDYGRLREIVGKACRLPEEFGYRVEGKKAREGGKLLGHPIHLRHLGLMNARLCLTCMDELRYVPAKWDLEVYVACPLHGTMMVTHCRACGRRLGHARRSLFECDCGADLRRTKRKRATAELLGLCEIVDCVATGSEATLLESQVLGMPAELRAMDLEVLLRVVSVLATVELQLSGGPSTPRRRQEITSVLSMVGKVVSNWPYEFVGLCKRWHQRAYLCKRRSVGFQQHFGWLFTRLHKNLFRRRSQTLFMLKEALKYGYENWRVSHIRLKEPELIELDLPAKRYLAAGEAAEVLGVPKYTMFRWLDSGRVPAVQRGKRSKRPSWLVDRFALQEIKFSKHAMVGQRDAARYLKLPHAVFRALDRQGEIERRRLVEFQYCFAREDLDEFRTKLLSTASAGPVELGAVRVESMLGCSTVTISDKVQFLTDVASGRAEVFGLGAKQIGDLLVPRRVIEQLKPGKRAPPGEISVRDAMDRYGLGYYQASAIFRLFGSRSKGKGMVRGVPARTIEQFLGTHVQLCDVARRLGVWAVSLARELKKRSSPFLVVLSSGRRTKRQGEVLGLFLKREGVRFARSLARSLPRRHAP